MKPKAALFACGALCWLAIAAEARAQCASEGPADNGPLDPGYGADANGDGVPDSIASAPGCSTEGNDRPSDPFCYLQGQAFVPSEYVVAGDGTPGTFWQRSGCWPAMAFPIEDSVASLGRGVVIVGASEATANYVRGEIRSGVRSWTAAFTPGARARDSDIQSAQGALCLVSFDYARPPREAIAVGVGAREPFTARAAATIANFYVHFCPSGLCDAPRDRAQLWPVEGLGLARSLRNERWSVRTPTFAGDAHAAAIERFAFARGVLYARAFDADRRGCAAAQATGSELAAIEAFDPTSGPPRFAHAERCRDPSGFASDSIRPPGVSLLPPDIDRLLADEAAQRAENTLGSVSCVLEGVPEGLIADVRAGSSRTAASAFNALDDRYLLANRALLVRSARDETRFVLVPEAIAFHDQTLVLVPRAGSFAVDTLRPTGAAERVGEGNTRRVSQRFVIESVAGKIAERSVSAEESTLAGLPITRPHASTTDASEHYGTRWTSNDGPADCFATTEFADPSDAWLRFSYPLASGASAELAADFCPSALNRWLARTRPLREGTQPSCLDAESAMSDKSEIRAVVEAVGSCLAHPAPLPDSGLDASCGSETPLNAEECLRSGCNPLQPATCPDNPECKKLLEHVAAPSPLLQSCIADRALAGAEELLPASKHWPDVSDGDRVQFVPMVAMLRTTEDAEPGEPMHASMRSDAGAGLATSAWPTTRSSMTYEDAFFGGAHQTLDWNWVVGPSEVDAIDPAYRGIAVSESHYIKVENELEFGIPSGLWDAHVQLPECHRFNTHGIQDFSTFLQSNDTIAWLAQLWPTDFCSLFGVNRFKGAGEENSTLPATDCAPCIACDASDPKANPADEAGCHVGRRYFRAHFGRGLFSPITPSSVLRARPSASDSSRGSEVPETAFMAMDANWPACPKNGVKALSATQRKPLGLEDWKTCPHRISYFGRPVLDCGHGDDGCDDQHRLEIHPPHLLSLELEQKTLASGANQGECPTDTEPCAVVPVTSGCVTGTVSAAFGWSNVVAGRHLEFDLWPPPRPAGQNRLCVIGADQNQSNPATLAPVACLGYSILPSSLPAPWGTGSGELRPTLSCEPLPRFDPNHVHCVYDDPAAEQCTEPIKPVPADGSLLSYGNPRMTPRFATSIFEARIFLGWAADKDSCDRAAEDPGVCDE